MIDQQKLEQESFKQQISPEFQQQLDQRLQEEDAKIAVGIQAEKDKNKSASQKQTEDLLKEITKDIEKAAKDYINSLKDVEKATTAYAQYEETKRAAIEKAQVGGVESDINQKNY